MVTFLVLGKLRHQRLRRHQPRMCFDSHCINQRYCCCSIKYEKLKYFLWALNLRTAKRVLPILKILSKYFHKIQKKKYVTRMFKRWQVTIKPTKTKIFSQSSSIVVKAYVLVYGDVWTIDRNSILEIKSVPRLNWYKFQYLSAYESWYNRCYKKKHFLFNS